MASQNRPLSKEKAPDPATTYERAKPENESTDGSLTAPKQRPHEAADQNERAVTNHHTRHQDGKSKSD